MQDVVWPWAGQQVPLANENLKPRHAGQSAQGNTPIPKLGHPAAAPRSRCLSTLLWRAVAAAGFRGSEQGPWARVGDHTAGSVVNPQAPVDRPVAACGHPAPPPQSLSALLPSAISRLGRKRSAAKSSPGARARQNAPGWRVVMAWIAAGSKKVPWWQHQFVEPRFWKSRPPHFRPST